MMLWRPSLLPVLVLAGWLAAAACDDGGLALDPMLSAEPPGFESMDPAIQVQFLGIKNVLRRRIAEKANDDALGEACGRLGMWFHAYQLRERASLLYETASRLQPNEARWLYYRGISLSAMGRHQEAIDALSQAAELLPEFAALKVRLGLAWTEHGDDSAAVPWFEQAIRLEPGHLRARLGLAEIRDRQGRFDDAVELLEQALLKNPESSQIRYMLGSSLRKAGKLEEASEHLRATHGAGQQKTLGFPDPLFADVAKMDVGILGRLRKARLAMEARRFRRAYREFYLVAVADPSHEKATLGMIRALLALKRFAEAEWAAASAVEQFPDQVMAHFLLGRALAGGKADGAEDRMLEKYHDALEVDPRFVPALVALADFYEQQGEQNLSLDSSRPVDPLRPVDLLGRARAAQREQGNVLSSLSARYVRGLVKVGQRERAAIALSEDLAMTDEPWALRVLIGELGLEVDPE